MTRNRSGRGVCRVLPLGLAVIGMVLTTGCQSLAVSACDGSLEADVAGSVAESAITEASGISGGWTNPDVWWVHNDSGDSARIFAVGTDGADEGTFPVTGSAAVDWEDIAIGPGPVDGTPYLYVGDIGDNSALRASIQVYRFAEPTVTGSDGVTDAASVLTLTYPDGPRDAEALMVDPDTGELFVVSKSYSGNATVYQAPADLAGGSSTVLTAVANLSLGSLQAVTGGEISAGGDSILLRTYQGIWAWDRASDQTVAEAMALPACAGLAVAEGQGEAIGFAGDSSGYVTVSEGGSQPLNWFHPVEP